MNIICAIWVDESGTTAIEYGIITALISISAIVSMAFLGGYIKDALFNISNTLAAGVASGR